MIIGILIAVVALSVLWSGGAKLFMLWAARRAEQEHRRRCYTSVEYRQAAIDRALAQQDYMELYRLRHGRKFK